MNKKRLMTAALLGVFTTAPVLVVLAKHAPILETPVPLQGSQLRYMVGTNLTSLATLSSHYGNIGHAAHWNCLCHRGDFRLTAGFSAATKNT
jgi:hypothetical protein